MIKYMKNRLREMRINSGMTQKEFARKVPMHTVSYNRLEQGCLPKLRTALLIAKVFKYKVEDIWWL